MISVFNHPWLGGLFADEDCHELFATEAQLQHMLEIEASFSRALGYSGRLNSELAEAAAKLIGTAKIDVSALRDGTARDGVVVPELVRQLKRLPGIAEDAVHNGMTSQDVIDSALSLTLKRVTDLLSARLSAVISCIRRFEIQFGENTVMGRTRMQAALPIPLSHRLEAWVAPLEAHLDRLEGLRGKVELLQLGGPVGTGSELGDERKEIAEFMSNALGLKVASCVWHTSRDGIVEYASVLSLISGALGKVGTDLCLMAQQGIDEATFQKAGGSSAMAHKNNPVLAELLVTLARFNATQVSAMHQSLIHEQERSGAAWTLEWMVLPQMAMTTSVGLAKATELLETVQSFGQAARDA